MLKRDRIEAGDANRLGWVVEDHPGGAIPIRQLLAEPIELVEMQRTGRTAGMMAGEQDQPPGAEGQGARRQAGHRPENLPQQGGIVVIAGKQRQGKACRGQQVAQMAIASQAFVLAEIAADQEQIRPPVQLGQGLRQPVAEMLEGNDISVITCLVCEEVGITQLENLQAWGRTVRAGRHRVALEGLATVGTMAPV